jgi:hypothetical protein
MPSPEYTNRYRRAAWHALDVAFATEEEIAGGWFVDPVIPDNLGGWLADFTHDLELELAEDLPPDTVKKLGNSREAEAAVKCVSDRLLAPRGFQSHSVQYQSYWRRPRADGVWVRAGSCPQRVHLEVKLGEDIKAPFCQVFEGIGIADAVIQVRVVKPCAREKLDALIADHPWLSDLKKHVQECLPIRFVEVG